MDDPKRRRAWLAGIAARLPRLFASIAEGNVEAGFVLGEKRIGERRVQLTLVARVVDGAAQRVDTWDVLPALAPVPAADPTSVSDVDVRDDDEAPERPEGPSRWPRRSSPLEGG